MKLELIKSGDNRYKLISSSNAKHPALAHIASMVKEANKHSDIKLGIYNVTEGNFTLFKRVYSYISQRTDKMNRKRFYEFIRGKRQIKQTKNSLDAWTKSINSENVLEFLEK